MRRILSLTFVLLIVSLSAIVEETESFTTFIREWETHIVEGIAAPNYNLYSPFDVQTNGFGEYVIPSVEDLENWSLVIDSFVEGDLEAVDTLITFFEFPYEVVIFSDTDTDRTYNMLREIPNLSFIDDNGTTFETGDDEIGAFDHAWGLYIHNFESEKPIVITTPHPNDDFITVPISAKAFQTLDARYICFSGAGREIIWTEVGNYTNSKSLCDPSRVAAHTFNVAYQRFADEIRDTFQKREFSIQIHSYDWGTRHEGYANLQISGGYHVKSPDLPIRDHSDFKSDLFNSGSYQIHEANQVGINPEIFLNDFSAVHCTNYDFEYSNADTLFDINTNIDLPGYSQNKQGVYTFTGWNHYDIIEPFFHIEMDELPNQYPQNEYDYHWFYGWDSVSESWIIEERYTRLMSYYTKWIDRLVQPLNDMFEMNDNLTPEIPQNLEILGEDYTNAVLSWEKISCYDFHTYQILYATEPISEDNYQIWDRNNDAKLACTAQTSTSVNLSSETMYYFKIRALDKNGNYSNLSNEVSTITSPININNFVYTTNFQSILLEWETTVTSPDVGFNIYRKNGNEDYSLLDSWQTNPTLQCNNYPEEFTYQYYDTNLVNDTLYTYKLVVQNAENYEFEYHELIQASPINIFELSFIIEDSTKLLHFASSADASHTYNPEYDVVYQQDNYFGVYFYHQYWYDWWQDPEKFTTEIIGEFDEVNGLYQTTIVVDTDEEQEITVNLSSVTRNNERFYISLNNQLCNMQEEDLVFTPSESTTSLQLIWGNATPNVEFANPEKKIFSPNELATFNWTTQYAQLVDYYNLYLENDDLSIPLAFNVSNFQQEFNWVVQQITQENLRLRIECVMREGDIIEYYSSFKVGIVPNEIFITADSGWSLIGHPFQDENMSIEEMYSPSAQFYRYAMNLFFEETVLNPYRGYWLHSDEEIYTILDSVTTYETEQSIELQYGWNIIPNPHQIQYDIEQLQLNYLGNNYDFYAAIQEGIIFPDVYRNEDGFAKTSILEKQKSYYLYSAYNDVFLIFDPYYSPDNGFDLPKDWFVKVSAIQENIDGGHILVGSAPTSTDGFDYLYDSYLPTAKPFDIQLNMGLLNENIPDEKMYSNFIENVEDFSDVNLEWEANVEVDSLAPINFTGICDNLPENVNCYLVFEDTNIHITNNCLKTYYPETNSIDFIVRITTDELDNFEDVITPEKLSVMNFPNPFNPTTKIKFTIPEKAEVSINIFNIKGQQVRKLVNSQFTAGQYSVVWDGKDNFEKQVSSGVYFYKINSGEEHIVRKMLMMK